MEICKHNQNGFCKFRERCDKRHENEICRSRNECTDSECTKRHPRECKYFQQCGYCKFSDTCAYSHMDYKNNKIETLEKDVIELKENMMKIKKELSEKIEKEVSEIKEEMKILKKDVSELKKLLAYMNRKINAIEPLNKEENDKREDNKHEEKAECMQDDDKNDDNNTRNNEIKNGKQGQAKFKCEQCDYEVKKKVTLIKHINTKHGKVNKADEQVSTGANKVNEETKEKKGNLCQECTSCENCDYLDNNDCEMCDKLFEADIQEYKTGKTTK